jgi:hypothetical protein
MANEYYYPYPYPYPYFQQPQVPPGDPMTSGHSHHPHPGLPTYATTLPGTPGYGVAYDPSHQLAAQAVHSNQATQQNSPFFNVGNERFLRGLVMGAAATYILTNEKVQRSTIKGMVRVWSTWQGGVEELKERFQDAEAELRATEGEDE